jgi:hypothetical protein
MNKTIRLNSVTYEMLVELAKKNRVKPEQAMEIMINDLYSKLRK